jgi:hypothetical protein
MQQMAAHHPSVCASQGHNKMCAQLLILQCACEVLKFARDLLPKPLTGRKEIGIVTTA